MGIPSYFSYIVKNHTRVIRKLDKKFLVNNLYLDANSVIYDCVHKIDFTKLVDSDITTIQNAVFAKLDESISLIQPNNNIFIAFDGVAPVAKLEQQRQRRYKSSYQNKVFETITKKPDPWNTTAITPGTDFMHQLNKQVRIRFNDPNKYNVKRLLVSPSDEYGEGEHKLFKYIRDNESEHKDATTIIYGLDADLIMLSINHLPISRNIYLYRETPHFIQSINSDLLPDESYLIDIPELSNIITTTMNSFTSNDSNTAELNYDKNITKINRVYDYILLCFFLGNDFMPHFPSINIRTGGIDKMLNAYKATMGSKDVLTDGTKINWRNMRKLILFLSKAEENNFKQEMKLRDKRENASMPEDTPEDKIKKFDALPTYKRDIEKYINPFNPNWEKRYYKSLFELEIDDTRKQQICVNYLEGLEWTLKYYTSGCPDWRWHYKYNYPPLLSDLIQHVPYFDTEFISKKADSPVSEVTQLCYVLPKQSMKMLPSKVYDKVIRDHKHLYNDEFKFQWAFCRYFWESHAVLPEIDIEDLEMSIGSI